MTDHIFNKHINNEVLINDENYSFEEISDKNTFYAKGLNFDYLLILVNKKNNVYIEKFEIEKNYQEVFDEIVSYMEKSRSEKNANPLILVEILKNSELPNFSKKIAQENKIENFNFCISLASKYLPLIPVDINQELMNLLEKVKNVEYLLKSGSYRMGLTSLSEEEKIEKENKTYNSAMTSLSENFSKYIITWIHAYRITMSIRSSKKNNAIIAHSHKYRGWSLPEYKLNEDLSFKFNTNFGYGNSSYFYNILVFKNLQIFPFMDWCNYKYAQVSEMMQYTEIFHEVNTNQKKKVIIKEEFWEDAMNFVAEACNTSIQSEYNFINKYIVEPIENLISFLNEIVEISDDELNRKYRSFEYGLEDDNDSGRKEKITKIKLMSVKGSRVSGALDFICKFKELSVLIKNSSIYIKKIENFNEKIKPWLEKIYIESSELLKILKQDLDKLQSKLIELYQGSNSQIGLKDMRLDKKNLDEISFKEKYPYFLEKENIYIKNLKKKQNLQNDIKNVSNLLKNIKSYNDKIDNYFNKTKPLGYER